MRGNNYTFNIFEILRFAQNDKSGEARSIKSFASLKVILRVILRSPPEADDEESEKGREAGSVQQRVQLKGR